VHKLVQENQPRVELLLHVARERFPGWLQPGRGAVPSGGQRGERIFSRASRPTSDVLLHVGAGGRLKSGTRLRGRDPPDEKKGGAKWLVYVVSEQRDREKKKKNIKVNSKCYFGQEQKQRGRWQGERFFFLGHTYRAPRCQTPTYRQLHVPGNGAAGGWPRPEPAVQAKNWVTGWGGGDGAAGGPGCFRGEPGAAGTGRRRSLPRNRTGHNGTSGQLPVPPEGGWDLGETRAGAADGGGGGGRQT